MHFIVANYSCSFLHCVLAKITQCNAIFFFYLKSLFVCLGAFKKILKMLAQWFNTSSPTLKANQKEPVNEAEKSPLNIYVYVTHSSTLVFVIFCYNTPDLGYITISVSPSH